MRRSSILWVIPYCLLPIPYSLLPGCGTGFEVSTADLEAQDGGQAGAGAAAGVGKGTALPKRTARRVTVQGVKAASAEEGRPSAAQLLDLVRGIPSHDFESRRRLVVRWPDAALELLRDTAPDEAARPERLAIASGYDDAFGPAGSAAASDAGWVAALSRLAADREGVAAHRRARGRAIDQLEAGDFAAAAASAEASLSALPADAPAALRAEAARLAGLSALLDDKPARTADLLGKALADAGRLSSHQRLELGLLLAEAARRAGRAAPAAEAWRSAVVAGAAVRDPELWDRAAAVRPPSQPWPAELSSAWSAADASKDDLSPAPGTAPTTADVLMRVGRMRLVRAALQPALLTFSRAETEAETGGESAGPRAVRLRAAARLYRAQTMVALQQAATALPMLEALVREGDPAVARRAQAALGDVLCRTLEDRRRGLPILREAVLAADGGDWPDKARALANLGLYCLLDGREAEGLRHLHDSQARLERDGRWEDLVRSLRNEAGYLRSVGRDSDASSVETRADDEARRHGIAEDRGR